MAIGALVSAALVLGGVWVLWLRDSEPTSPGPDALAVEFSLLSLDEDDFRGSNRAECGGVGGYSDFGPGMTVTVTNESGKIIGSGQTRSLGDLGANMPRFYNRLPTVSESFRLEDELGIMCTVAALVPLSESADFYKVEIGRRGDTSYSRKELEERGWILELSLGDLDL